MFNRRRTLLLMSVLIAAGLQAQAPAAFDLIITNGHIMDGTGSPWYSGDLGIRDGKIAAIGNLSSAPRKRTIDAAGKVVAPGFIDMLGQSELTILVEPTSTLKDLSRDHLGNHRRRKLNRAAGRCNHSIRSRRLRAVQDRTGLAHSAPIFCAP